MPQYLVLIDGHEYSILLGGDQAFIDGKPVAVDLLKLNDTGLYLLSQDKEAIELYLHNQDASTLEVLANGQLFTAKVETPQRRAHKNAEDNQAGVLVAPIPGLVVEVCVQQDEFVETGQTMLVLESMKMQMKIRALIAGQVTEIGVQVGKQVEKGALLIRVEPVPQ
jgi:biotin carboxyl carrier protein